VIKMNYQARFSGRQRLPVALPPAEAGWRIFFHSLPRAAHRSTSFRSACPGLNSAAGSAGSLKSSASRFLWFALALLLLAFVLEGCTHGINSGTDGWPPASSTAPAGISSSASVVKVRAADVSIPAGGNADATVTLSISPGYHINANPATFSYLISTEVSQAGPLDDSQPLMGKPVYPSGVTKKFAFAEKPLAVYEGDVTIKLPIRLGNNKSYVHVTKGAHISIPLTVRVQACDSEKCYAPDTLKTTIAVDVK
jgi:hypothetical protein